jgi:hypothetical protein
MANSSQFWLKNLLKIQYSQTILGFNKNFYSVA